MIADQLTQGDAKMPEYSFVMDREKMPIATRSPAYEWAPQPDITVYELACALRYLITGRTEGLSGEPESVRRHFRELGAAENGANHK